MAATAVQKNNNAEVQRNVVAGVRSVERVWELIENGVCSFVLFLRRKSTLCSFGTSVLLVADIANETNAAYARVSLISRFEALQNV